MHTDQANQSIPNHRSSIDQPWSIEQTERSRPNHAANWFGLVRVGVIDRETLTRAVRVRQGPAEMGAFVWPNVHNFDRDAAHD